MKSKDIMRRIGFQPVHFIFATVLSFVSAFFEAVSVGTLIPMLKGIIGMDFGFVKQYSFSKIIFKKFPNVLDFSNREMFILLLSIIFTAAVLKDILEYASSLILSRQLRKTSNGFMQLIFERYLSFGKQFFDRSSLGYLHTVLLGFSNQVISQIMLFKSFLSSFFMLLAYLVIMLKVSWQLTLFVVIFFPIIYYSSDWLIKKIKTASKSYSDSYSRLSRRISNILSCIPLVKLYSAEEREKKHFSVLSTEIEKLLFSMDKKSYLIGPLQHIIFLVEILLLVLIMVFIVVKTKTVEIGSFLVYFYLIKQVFGSFTSLNNMRMSLAHISGPMAEISKVFDDKDKFFISQGVKDFPGIKEKIEFQNLSFCYLKDTCILNDLSFSIEKGKTTAIVGPTGAGKTTIISLLLRFYDSGPSSIIIDNVDIRDFTSKSLRAHMTLVSQDILLFNDTLRNNIIYGLEIKPTEEEINDAIKKARLYDFVVKLPEGLDTLIGDRGIRLSGGEKQRVAIARAFLKKAEILILDEATSPLDTRTEKLIQEAINEAIKDKTAIVIAHRLSTIQNADKIIVIEKGQLVEQGPLNELLDRKGKFYDYWQEQKFF